MKKSVVFLHPDLGIGGAERLVVDLALAAHQSRHPVKFITNHHDPSHCFEETNSQLDVEVVGSWFPRSIFGHCIALCAYVRFLIAAIFVIYSVDKRTTIVFVDQISAPLVALYFAGFKKTCFYCHFPDQLLTEKNSFLKRIYRYPIDLIEEYSMRFADKLLVNSNFTADVVKKTFPSLVNIELEVLYPVPNAASLHLPSNVLERDASDKCMGDQQLCRSALPPGTIPRGYRFLFVSMNRYERKKNLNLAIYALEHLCANWDEFVNPDKCLRSKDVHLVIAGGYDYRVPENVEYYQELADLVDELNLSDQVTFVRSCSSAIKSLLIASSDAVLYTPDAEHFGIVPTEAMLLARPVIALDSGGPRETIVDGVTGFLRPTTNHTHLPALFASSISRFINDPTLVRRMGKEAQKRVANVFSFEAFQKHLDRIITSLS